MFVILIRSVEILCKIGKFGVRRENILPSKFVYWMSLNVKSLGICNSYLKCCFIFSRLRPLHRSIILIIIIKKKNTCEVFPPSLLSASLV